MEEKYWQFCNPKNWDKDTRLSGAMAAVMMIVCYFIIVIFH